MDTGKKAVTVVQTPLGLTEQNTHSDNLWWVSMLAVLLGVVILAALVYGFMQWKKNYDRPSRCNNDLTEI